jgi:hypothetical protein
MTARDGDADADKAADEGPGQVVSLEQHRAKYRVQGPSEEDRGRLMSRLSELVAAGNVQAFRVSAGAANWSSHQRAVAAALMAGDFGARKSVVDKTLMTRFGDIFEENLVVLEAYDILVEEVEEDGGYEEPPEGAA